MPTTDFLAFATGAGANVLDQADFAAASWLSQGFSSGVALSENLNKVWRQSSFVTAGLTQWLANAQSANVSDDGNLTNFVNLLTAALPSKQGANSWASLQTFSLGANFGANGFAATQISGAPTYALAPNVYLQLSGGNLFLNNGAGEYVYLDTSGNLHTNGIGKYVGALQGNADTATKLATGRTIGFSGGDVTGTISAFDGSTNLTNQTLTLATVNSNTGTFGSASGLSIPSFTVNAKGLITAASAGTIPSATTSQAGVLKTATSAQVMAGSDATAAVTSAALAGAFAPSVSGSETDFALPGGGIIKSGVYSGSVGSAGSVTINFATPFPNALIWASATLYVPSPSGSTAYAAIITAMSASSVTFQVAGYQSGGTAGDPNGFVWAALGR